MKPIFRHTVAWSAVFILVLGSCNKYKPGNSGTPQLPAFQSLAIDFSSNQINSSLVRQQSNISEYSNFSQAVSLITYWSALASTYTELPALAYHTVISNGNPSFNSSTGQWIWSQQFDSSTLEGYIAELYGTATGDSVYWEMYLTKVADGSKFKWFEGESHQSHGWWKVYNPLIDGGVLLVNWEKNTSNQTGSVTYTDIIAKDVNKGSYITSGNTTPTHKYLKIKIISDKSSPQINNIAYTIDWDASSKAGSLIWNGGQLCWDQNLMNTTCK